MKVTFVYRGAEQLGLEYLSSVLKQAGHRTYLAFDPGLFDDKRYIQIRPLNRLYNYRKVLINKILSSKPDLIGFSVVTDLYQWACEVAKEVKKITNVPIIFGGIHPSSVPEIIRNEFIDMVGIGECEDALLELVNSLETGKIDYTIRNIWFKKNGEVIRNPVRPLVQNLDSLPILDKELFERDINIKYHYRTLAGRDCPFACSFCCHSVLKGIYKDQQRMRKKRHIENVLEELRIFKKRYDIKYITFEDDIFTYDKDWINDFLPQYKSKIGISFYCVSHIKYIDGDIVSLLKESGCKLVELGIQTMARATRINFLKRYESNEEILEAIKLCETAKLPYVLDHIFGLPGEGEGEYLQAAKIYKKLKYCQKIQTFAMTYYPETEIVKLSKQKGFIDSERMEEINNGKEKHYFFGGSVKDKKLSRLNKNFEVLFKLMPLFKEPCINIILKYKIYKIFSFIPIFLISLWEILTAMIKKDLRFTDYSNYYLIHLIRRFKNTKQFNGI